MIKQFCDKCEAEITKAELPGQVTYFERTFPLEEKIGGKPNVQQTTKLLCERCITKLRKHL